MILKIEEMAPMSKSDDRIHKSEVLLALYARWDTILLEIAHPRSLAQSRFEWSRIQDTSSGVPKSKEVQGTHRQ